MIKALELVRRPYPYFKPFHPSSISIDWQVELTSPCLLHHGRFKKFSGRDLGAVDRSFQRLTVGVSQGALWLIFVTSVPDQVKVSQALCSVRTPTLAVIAQT